MFQNMCKDKKISDKLGNNLQFYYCKKWKNKIAKTFEI